MVLVTGATGFVGSKIMEVCKDVVAAHCAEKIALRCKGMDPEKADILGLLHDKGGEALEGIIT